MLDEYDNYFHSRSGQCKRKAYTWDPVHRCKSSEASVTRQYSILSREGHVRLEIDKLCALQLLDKRNRMRRRQTFLSTSRAMDYQTQAVNSFPEFDAKDGYSNIKIAQPILMSVGAIVLLELPVVAFEVTSSSYMAPLYMKNIFGSPTTRNRHS